MNTFNAFTEYDLSEVVEQHKQKIKQTIIDDIRSDSTEDKDAYFTNLIEKQSIEKIVLDTENIQVSEEMEMIPAEWHPQSFLVESGESYERQVIQFHVPFVGEEELLHCVPSTRLLSTEKIATKNNHITFKIINFNDDSEAMKSKRDSIVNFLQEQLTHVNGQISQFNEDLPQFAEDIYMQEIKSSKKNLDLLNELGKPLQKNN
jgi:hypothetical protein